MRSKFLISYTLDGSTNLIGYEDQEERDYAYRLYTEIGILTAYGTQIRPEQICAHDTVACASYRVEYETVH